MTEGVVIGVVLLVAEEPFQKEKETQVNQDHYWYHNTVCMTTLYIDHNKTSQSSYSLTKPFLVPFHSL